MQSKTQTRGFAAMSVEKQREIARKGGKAAHAKGTAHEFSTDEAREAGRKGGVRVSMNRDHMANIGRLGGKNSAGRRKNPPDQNGEPAGVRGNVPDQESERRNPEAEDSK